MAMSYVTFVLDNSQDFKTNLENHMFLIQKLVSITFGYKMSMTVERVSFVDYDKKAFYHSFPFNTQLHIHNTSTMQTFGFGRYNGAFFDVILRMNDGNPLNLKIFYGIDEKQQQDNMIFILGQNRKCYKKGRLTLIDYNGDMISLTEAKKLEKSEKKKNVHET
jgi:hypothetical protein